MRYNASKSPEPILDLDNYEIPSVKNGEFNIWFDELSYEEFQQIWSDPRLRNIMESRIRNPGGLHEWLLVSRADKFKEWGVSMDSIKDLRTKITNVEFKNPYGIHGGVGSTTAHNEIKIIIDSSSNFDDYVNKLNI